MKHNAVEQYISSDHFDLPLYLERVGFKGDLTANYESIRQLMWAQLCTVPFENLDVQAGKVVSLDPNDIVDKIVGQHRGGYCYEVNGLFALALQSIGVAYYFVAARPMFYPVKRPKTHMGIIATIDNEDYLIDLGFGSYGIREPLKLSAINVPITQGNDTYMLEKINDREFLVKAFVNGVWAKQYAFELHHQEWIDFAPANFLNSTHPDAVFVQKPLIIIYTPQGRKVLLGETFKIIADGTVTESTYTPEEYDQLLLDHFSLKRM